MDTRWIKLCFLLILCPEYFGLADSATVQGTLDPKPPIKGSPHTIKCDFNLGGDSLQQLKLYLGTEALAKNAVAFISIQGTAVWGSSVPASLNQRGYLQGSRDENYLSLVINSTDCTDKDRIYLCALETLSSGSVAQVVNANITSLSQLQAAPLAPGEMQRTPTSETVVQHSNMTFECSGNVGRPAGTFRWYTYTGSGSSTGLEVTSQAVSENEVLSGDGCTYTRVSRLTLNLTRTEPSERLVVRCRVDQALVPQGQTGCSDPDTEFCRMSPGINVQYPVRVSATSDTVSAQEGSDLTLQCFASGNPPPSGLGWQREGENETTAGASLTLGSISMGDAGTYVCSAFNTIDGVQQNASYAVTVVVEKTTTAPPTTTSTSTKSTTTEEKTDKAGSDDTTTIIIVVVVVVVAVIVIALIAVFCVLRRRRRQKEVEEPPEKPFNSNAAINTVAARPDLVNNSYDNGPPYKNEDGLAYAELQFDNRPRSRRPMAINDMETNYADVSMPQV